MSPTWLGLPRFLPVLTLKVPCPGGHISPGQAGTVGHSISKMRIETQRTVKKNEG